MPDGATTLLVFAAFYIRVIAEVITYYHVDKVSGNLVIAFAFLLLQACALL